VASVAPICFQGTETLQKQAAVNNKLGESRKQEIIANGFGLPDIRRVGCDRDQCELSEQGQWRLGRFGIDVLLFYGQLLDAVLRW
jgi:hypothetical protein